MSDEEKKFVKSEAALREEKVLEFWRENKIFEKSVEARKGEKEFVFYDGPVTANSKPVLHTMVPFSFKDVLPRYKTMRGYHARRKGGWDTHGLPVELQIEKKLGFKSKTDIENYGIAAFNKLCKDSVWEYTGLWKSFTSRMGYWADQENAFVTYHNEFIESLWSIVKKVDEQGLLYKDYKVVPWCPRCGTALSSHELAQGYQDVKDVSVYVKFKIKNPESKGLPENTYILAWTTTPWTLPGNVGLAVGEEINYVKFSISIATDSLGRTFNQALEQSDIRTTLKLKPRENFICAKECLEKIKILCEKEGFLIIENSINEFKGKDLVGLEYEPLFPYFAETISDTERLKLEKAYKVYVADFVTTEDGTGVVHTAVMYGQEDFELGTKVGLPKHHTVNLEGNFIKGAGFLEGRFVKEKDENGKPTIDVYIINYLTEKNYFFSKENYTHSYPHCWRCKTALIYYARDSWYIKMSDPKVKNSLIEENKKINWEPSHIREGRFGEWLKDIKDWAISRERYWGTPLPVWNCTSCEKRVVLGSMEEIKSKTKKSGNKYVVMRHGEAQSNVQNNMHGVVSSKVTNEDHLTEEGKAQVRISAEKMKSDGVSFDFIFASPFLRTKETLEIIKEVLSIKDEQIKFDDRLVELNAGDFEGKPWDEYRAMFKDEKERFTNAIHGGESLLDLKKRVGNFFYDLEEKYQGKKILVISHGAPLWLSFAILNGFDTDESISMTGGLFRRMEEVEKGVSGSFSHFANAEYRNFDFIPISHNEDYDLDLHRPFIDSINILCDCGGTMVRTKEVMDVWFDSGAMPFAQDHYPFENKDWVDGPGYPADFISEAIDQTRGWFYTLHAVGVLMGRGVAYKNVICLGHLLDANGKKMSKSIGNVVDPWEAMDKYGVDTLRLWMYSVNQPGESKNFDEKTVSLLQQQFFGLLYNVLAFYELYRDKNLEKDNASESENILDLWILARLNELVDLSTKNLDNYKLLEPVRAMREFIGDLSTWYLRRSRERIKDGDVEAKATLYFVLKTLAKLIAPFAPFAAEDIWLRLKNSEDKESVHLADWPLVTTQDLRPEILKQMQIVRDICTAGNAERQKSGIPVRQPLLKIEIKDYGFDDQLKELIKDELNIKEVVVTKQSDDNVSLSTEITPALKAEGEYREFMRELQDMRKKLGLKPNDKMPMTIEMIYKKYKILPNLREHMLRVAAVASIICDNFDEPLPKEDIVTACLLHDMGNIIKFQLDVFLKFLEPEGLEYWTAVQNEYFEKYGKDEHEATLKILKEINSPASTVELIDTIHFSLICKHSKNSDMSRKIFSYSDNRVSPFGVVSYNERMEEARKRYQNRKDNNLKEDERERLVACGRDIEKQIFAKCKIKPEDINDQTVAPIILELRNFVLK